MLISAVVSAEPARWELKEVTNKSHQTIGYVYYTEAVGTIFSGKAEKYAVSFRLVCSLKTTTPDPLILLNWEPGKINNIGYHKVNILFDNIPMMVVDTNDVWVQDNNVVYRHLLESRLLINQLANSKTIKFTWMNKSSIKHSVMFDTSTFSMKFLNFIDFCKLNLPDE